MCEKCEVENIPNSIIGCLQEIIRQNTEILKNLKERPTTIVIEKLEIDNASGMNDSNNISLNGEIEKKVSRQYGFNHRER